MAPDEDVPDENEQQVEEELDGENIVMHCALHNDIERLKKVFMNVEDPHHEEAGSLIDKRVKVGKTPIEMAAMLGRSDVIKELIRLGADVNQQSSEGYSPLHFATSWGHVACLDVLFQAGAKLDVKTSKGETPRQIGVRYNRKECTEFLDWAAAKVSLVSFIAHIREMIADPEKMQGVKPSKEEKTTVISSCNEKQEWLDEAEDPTVEDFLTKKMELEKQIEFLTIKINSPAPGTGSSGKK